MIGFSLKSKDDICKRVCEVKNHIINSQQDDLYHSQAFYDTFCELADRFVNEVNKLILFESLEDSWEYQISCDYDGMVLQLVHYDISLIDEDNPISRIDQTYNLLDVRAPYLSTEEYAEIYKISSTTVRTWIRRGKIRSAQKIGSEWRIPALTDVPERGFKTAGYSWEENLKDIPDEYAFLNKYRSLVLEQCKKKGDTKFFLYLYEEERGNASEEMIISNSDREKLELMLISHPSVKYDMSYADGLMIDIMNNFKKG